MYSFKIRDRQTAFTIRLLLADCVGIASGSVLGVTECELTVSGVDGVRACGLV
jgi:hypothetical protein